MAWRCGMGEARGAGGAGARERARYQPGPFALEANSLARTRVAVPAPADRAIFGLEPTVGPSDPLARRDMHEELLSWRKEFPILERTIYMISNSLGPHAAQGP